MTTDKTDTCLLWGFGRCEGEGLETAAGCCCCSFDCSLPPSTMSERPNAQRGLGGEGGGEAWQPAVPDSSQKEPDGPQYAPAAWENTGRSVLIQAAAAMSWETRASTACRFQGAEQSSPLVGEEGKRKSVATTGPPPVASHASRDKRWPSRRRLSTPGRWGGEPHTTFLAKLTLHNELTSSSRQLHF